MDTAKPMTDHDINELRSDSERLAADESRWLSGNELDANIAARKRLVAAAPKLLALIAAQVERIKQAEEVIRPFALDLRPEVPDDQLIDTLAWTAGEHRAAHAFIDQAEK